MKTCSKCKEEKDFLCFHRSSYNKDGFKSQCIECRKTPAQKYREENKEKISETHKEHYKKNQDRLKKKQRAYYTNNKPKVLEYQKEYARENSDKIKKRQREYWGENPLAYFKIKVRNSICDAFSRRKKLKNLHSEEILGCTMDDFFVYIASQFKEGMSLKNYGEWHLDHIIPLAIAETEEDVIFLCHYLNYQPLWAEENLAKGSSI